MNRRGFLRLGLGAAFVIGAPAIVTASSLMRIVVPRPELERWCFPANFDESGLQLLMQVQREIDMAIGIDLGRPGGDQTVIALRQGHRMHLDRFVIIDHNGTRWHV